MSKRLIIIPRWSGTPASDWYPWLQRELLSVGRVGGPPPYRDLPLPFDPVVVSIKALAAQAAAKQQQQAAAPAK